MNDGKGSASVSFKLFSLARHLALVSNKAEATPTTQARVHTI
jgi:hypothetical protein